MHNKPVNAAALEAEHRPERHRGPLRILHPAVGAFVVATISYQCVREGEKRPRGEKINRNHTTSRSDLHAEKNDKDTTAGTGCTFDLRYRLDDGLVGRGHLHHGGGLLVGGSGGTDTDGRDGNGCGRKIKKR